MGETLQWAMERLTIPGLPSWVGLVLLVAIGVLLLAFLAMPFAVFGVKSRLEAVEAELADLRGELRAVLRQPGLAPPRAAVVEEEWVSPPGRRARPEPEIRVSPPVPPPAPRTVRSPARAEPRLDWPGRGEREG